MEAIARVAFGLFGLSVLVGLTWLFSSHRKAVDWKLVLTGVALQIAFATLVLLGSSFLAWLGPDTASVWFTTTKYLAYATGAGALAHLGAIRIARLERLRPFTRPLLLGLAVALAVFAAPYTGRMFDWLSRGFVKLLEFTGIGSQLIFGELARGEKFGFIFAFQVLPTIIFFASLMGMLYHLGVMQWIVRGMAWAITKVMRVSGAETTSVCASVFIGQTEAPLTIRPYIARMTPSELLTIMVGGMAHIAGGVLAAYIGMLGGNDPVQQAFYAKHLLTASIMAAPATLVISKILMPEVGEPLTRGQVKMEVERSTANVIDAAAAGAGDGLRLALNVGAMLLAFTALIALFNAPLTWLGEYTGVAAALGKPTDLGTLLGYLLAPIAWVIGVPWQDATVVGGLIGQKIVLNEFIAYLALSDILQGKVSGVTLSDEGRLIATYALCGFANFSSIAIQIGGIGGLAPERRQDLARLGLRAVLGGSVATFMTATIAGVLSGFSS